MSIAHQEVSSLLRKGFALHRQGRLGEAKDCYEMVLRIDPKQADTLSLLGTLYAQSGHYVAAIELLRKAIEQKPNIPETYNSLGNCHKAIDQLQEALRCYDQAVLLKDDYAEVYSNRANVLSLMGRRDDALNNYQQSLALNPNSADTLCNYGGFMLDYGKPESALELLNKALALSGRNAHSPKMLLWNNLFWTKLTLCEWDTFSADIDRLRNSVTDPESVATPFHMLNAIDDLSLQKKCAQYYAKTHCPESIDSHKFDKNSVDERICIGYFSADFHEHATMHLIARMLELHDKSKFRILGFSFGPNIQDEYRRRAVEACDEFIDVSEMSSSSISLLARQLKVDIAVDLKGYTKHSRPKIFADRCAPLQVNYLGYPGTMGTKQIDYILADPVLIPIECTSGYTESVAYLPHCYQANDDTREMIDSKITRTELGLPEHAFVFCCFNAAAKINPDVFDIWMRLLSKLENSVLWLLSQNQFTITALRQEARKRGVDPDRLIFAAHMPVARHLARQSAADLFLDTWPYTAHTTASDALRMGLPLLCNAGESFASRVSASLLSALDLPELITHSPEDYLAKAEELANDPKKLASIVARLKQNCATGPLYNSELFTRSIERAYELMWDRYQAGMLPDLIKVDA